MIRSGAQFTGARPAAVIYWPLAPDAGLPGALCSSFPAGLMQPVAHPVVDGRPRWGLAGSSGNSVRSGARPSCMGAALSLESSGGADRLPVQPAILAEVLRDPGVQASPDVIDHQDRSDRCGVKTPSWADHGDTLESDASSLVCLSSWPHPIRRRPVPALLPHLAAICAGDFSLCTGFPCNRCRPCRFSGTAWSGRPC